MLPDAQRFAVLWDVNTCPYQRNAIIAAAKTLSVDLRILEFRELAGLESLLTQGLKDRPHAMVQLGSPLFSQFGSRIAEFLAPHRLPGISQHREFSTNGDIKPPADDVVAHRLPGNTGPVCSHKAVRCRKPGSDAGGQGKPPAIFRLAHWCVLGQGTMCIGRAQDAHRFKRALGPLNLSGTDGDQHQAHLRHD